MPREAKGWENTGTSAGGHIFESFAVASEQKHRLVILHFGVEGFILIVVIQRMHLAVDVGDEQVGPAILLTSGETNSKGNSGDDAAPAQS